MGQLAEGAVRLTIRFFVQRQLKSAILLTASLFLCCAFVLSQQTTVLVGVGSTVPLPLYKRWAQEYNTRNSKVRLEYLPLGTSEGIKHVTNGQSDFGAGEVPLGSSDKGIALIPMALIGIVPIYNLPGIHGELHFSGEVLAQILLGEIKVWNAPQISRLNPNGELPALPIRVVYRPAGKGSNFVITDFLSKASPAFRARIGVSASPRWPVGIAAERSSDMVDKVSSEPGSIGYVELQYASDRKIAFGAVLNRSGKFVKASAETLTAACEGAESPQWNGLGASLTYTPGTEAYPITGFTWFYVRTSAGDKERAVALADFLNWATSEGQQFAVQEGYTKLPEKLIEASRAKIRTLPQ